MKLDVTHAAAPIAALSPQSVARNEAASVAKPSEFAAKVHGEDAAAAAKPGAGSTMLTQIDAALDPQKVFAEFRRGFDEDVAPLRERRAELERAGIPHTDPRWREIGEAYDKLLLDMQTNVLAASARIELFGKLVEHTTSAVRTVAQTQV